MISALLPGTTISALRNSISKLDTHRDRTLAVTSVYQPEDGYYIESLELRDPSPDPADVHSTEAVLQSGQILTARMGTKYYKTSDSLRADLARLFTRDNAPTHLDLTEVNWSAPYLYETDIE